ncbi:MAG: sugar phosphate isomerase/epimerase [Bacteroidales bacterium]|jgi:sugar phosphate isomerase/epimerase|nr:sugar phosphate isomerase/epimerase [Bacteroidales bacterium]
MDRRDFLQKGAMAVLAGCGMSAEALAASMAKKSNRIGIQLYSIREYLPKDFTGSLQKLADIGYSHVEAYGVDGDKFLHKTLKETSAIVKDMGMKLTSTHCGTGLLPADTQAKEWDYWRKTAQAMKEVGGKFLAQPWVPSMKTIDELKRSAEQFNKVGEICKKNGLKFAFHNHDIEFKKFDGQGPVIEDFLLKNTDPELVFFQLDLGHVINGGGDILDYMRKYPKRFLSWHASDFKKGQGYIELGQGDVPWYDLFKIAKSYGLEDLTMEHESGDDRFAIMKRNFDYLAQFPWTKVKK